MPVNLLETIVVTFDDEKQSRIADFLDVEKADVEHDAPLVACTLLAGLIKKCSTPTGAESLKAKLSEAKAETQEDPVDQTGDAPIEAAHKMEEIAERGMESMDRIFGSGLDDLIGAVSRHCNLSRYQLRHLFSLAAEESMQAINGVKAGYRLKDDEVAALILMQNKTVREALPDNLYVALGLGRRSSFASQLRDAHRDSIEKAIEKADSPSILENTLIRKLAPVAALVLIAIVLWTVARACN